MVLRGVFDMLQDFETITPLVGRIDLLNKMRYILEVVALLETHKLERTLDDFSHKIYFYLLMRLWIVTIATVHH